MEKTEQAFELKKFVETFFANIGAEMNQEGEVFTISNVPLDFERHSGKKAPYKIRFDGFSGDSTEFITKGSTLLKAMLSYLDERGQTTLIKLDFERDYETELKHYLSLRNAELTGFNKKSDFRSFVRFSINTTLQYLNEKEQITNHLCVDAGKIKDFSLEKYSYVEGKKEEVPKMELKEEYEIAKSELKKIIKKRVDDTALNLSEKLNREIERIKNHYSKQKEEFGSGLAKLKEQKANFISQVGKVAAEEAEKINLKIKKISEMIENAEKSDFMQKMEKEEQFFINDEKHKHSLKINNKLINTSIIYYPIFTFSFFIKSKESLRRVEIVYDPMQDVLLKSIFCDSCEREIREIFLCSSGHITCSSCGERCMLCNSPLCLACTKKLCEICGKKLCKKCNVRCASCWKSVCSSHTNVNYANGKTCCLNCLNKCELCGNFTDKSRMRKKSEQNVCERCYRLSGII